MRGSVLSSSSPCFASSSCVQDDLRQSIARFTHPSSFVLIEESRKESGFSSRRKREEEGSGGKEGKARAQQTRYCSGEARARKSQNCERLMYMRLYAYGCHVDDEFGWRREWWSRSRGEARKSGGQADDPSSAQRPRRGLARLSQMS